MLTERQKKILNSIVKRYVETVSPIASDHLVKQCRVNYSSATIRNEMIVLEREGFLSQPHTSAGRVPTDKGYRFYVDTLSLKNKIPESAEINIQQQFEQHRGNVKLVLAEACKLLSQISNELSVVLTPWNARWCFDRLEFISLSHHKVLLVIHVRSRASKTVVLELDSDLDERDLQMTAETLNERLSGLMLYEIKETIKTRVQDVRRGNDHLIRKMVDHAGDLFDLNETLDVHTSGTENIVRQPEFSNHADLANLFAVVEDQKEILSLFQYHPSSIEVVIGGEHGDKRLSAFSVIRTSYRLGESIGTLGVIGPTRMPYDRVMPLVHHMAQTMNQYFG